MNSIMTARKTKIVCTLGPATDSPERIRALIQAGMDVARLNFSHGDHGAHRQTIHTIREVSKDLGKEIGIVQDLGGPKIRLGELPVKEREIESGETVVLRPINIVDPSDIPVNYPYFVEDVAVGDRILLADGLVLLNVKAKEKERVICEVVVGGTIHSHKGVNLPSSSLRIPAFTEKDRQDLAVGLEENVDFVALSFVRHEKDLEPVLEMLGERPSRPMLIAKIEKPQAIDRLEEILARVDGVMVARGDLGVEMPLEEVPIIQKQIIRRARHAGKPVITATQMLRSMISSPRPTRAEATDVANAILDGTDALMLSEETAMGAYPTEATSMLDRIARATEQHLKERSLVNEPTFDHLTMTASAISRSACILAEDLNAAAIVAATSSGGTARLVARFRPACPVLGLTPNPQTERQLALSWGVLPALVAPFSDTDEIFELARFWALEHDLVRPGDRLIVTAGVPVGTPGTTNLLKVIEIY
jgi:pyruvate kinase